MASVDGTCLDDAGNRWYRDPRNPTLLYASVTSILNIKAKPGLGIGLKNGVAKYAARNRHALAELTQLDVEKLLKDESVIVPDWHIAGDFGTAVHQVVENIINLRPLHENLKLVKSTKTYPVNNTFTEFVPQYFSEFMREHNAKPLMTERAVMSATYGYGGRFDGIMEIDGELAIVDVKSNKNGPKDEVAMQNDAYANADYIIDMETGRIEPLPKVTASYVLWIREEGWNLFPLKFGRPFQVFLKHLDVFNAWAREVPTFVGDPLHPNQIQPVKPFYR